MSQKERPKRVKLDVRAHAQFEESGGSWNATFPTLGLSATGATEEEAWENLVKSINEALSDDVDGARERWQKFVQEHGEEIELSDEDVEKMEREQRELKEKSYAASKDFRVLTAADFDEAIKSEKPLLVDFWADWCGPCHMLAPVLKEAADELTGRLEVAKLNVDDNKEFWQKLSIEGIPTMILFQGGQEKARIVGAGRSKDDLIKELEPHL